MSKEGWTTVTLGDIAENISVRVDDPSESGLDRFVGLVHLDSGSVTVSRWDSAESVTSTMKRFQAGDVLLARRNAHLRRASAVDFEGVCSGDAYVLREKPDAIVPGLLKYILNTNRFWEYAIANADGSMSTRVKWKSLENYKFRLPNKETQNSLRELMDGSLNNYLCNMAILKHLNNSLFSVANSMFGRYGLQNSKFGKVPLASQLVSLEECSSISLGLTLNARKDKGIATKFPYLRVANVGRYELSLENVKILPCHPTKFESKKLLRWDILVVEGHADKRQIGRASIWNDEIQDITHQNHIYRVRFDQNIVYPPFGLHWLNSTYSQRYFQSVCQSSSGLNTLNSKSLGGLLVPVISLEKQKIIADVISKFLSLSKEFETLVNISSTLQKEVIERCFE